MNTNSSNNKYGNIVPSLSGDQIDTGSSAYHIIDGVQVKYDNDANMSSSTKTLAFKVTNTTAITVYGATTSPDFGGFNISRNTNLLKCR